MWAGVHQDLMDPEWLLDGAHYVWDFDADDLADVHAYQAHLR